MNIFFFLELFKHATTWPSDNKRVYSAPFWTKSYITSWNIHEEFYILSCVECRDQKAELRMEGLNWLKTHSSIMAPGLECHGRTMIILLCFNSNQYSPRTNDRLWRGGHGTMVRACRFANVAACRAASSLVQDFQRNIMFSPLNLGQCFDVGKVAVRPFHIQRGRDKTRATDKINQIQLTRY